MTFAYIIPLFSSIRAVHHREHLICQKWITYFLILNIIQSINFILRFHVLFELTFIIWLIIPRFQGTFKFYSFFQENILEKYEIEVEIGRYMNLIKGEIQVIILRYMSNKSCILVSRAERLLSIIMNRVRLVSGNSYVSQRTTVKNNVVKDSLDISYYLAKTLNPQNSVVKLLKTSFTTSSGCVFKNNDKVSDFAQEQYYLRDFIHMLSNGLYIFSRIHINRENDTNVFYLVVFSFDSSDNFFCFTPVDNSVDRNEHDCSFHVSLISTVQSSGEYGIVFTHNLAQFDPSDDINYNDSSLLSDGSRTKNGSLLAEIRLSNETDRDALLQGILVYLYSLANYEQGHDY